MSSVNVTYSHGFEKFIQKMFLLKLFINNLFCADDISPVQMIQIWYVNSYTLT